MQEETNSTRSEEMETPSSGLLLSVEPLQGSASESASAADTIDTDTDGKDTSDAAGDSEVIRLRR